MRKWINIVEAVVLVAMLVFVVVNKQANYEETYVKTQFVPKDFNWNNFELSSTEVLDDASVSYRVVYDENNNADIDYYYNPESVLVRMDPQSLMLEKILQDTGKSIQDVKRGMLEYSSFSEFTDMLLNDAQSVVHFIDCQTKEIEVKRNDFLVLWSEIANTNAFYANQKEEMGTKTSKYDSESYDIIYQGSKLCRMKFYRANDEGQDVVEFDYITDGGLLAKSKTTVIVK